MTERQWKHMDDNSRNLASEDRLLNAGTLGVAVAAVTQLLQLDSLDWFLKGSVLFFAAAIPILSMNVFQRTMEVNRSRMLRKGKLKLVKWLRYSGLPIALIGITLIFFHFSIAAGLVFLGASALGLGAAVWHSLSLLRT
jgi:hypothetical protein